MPQILTNEQIRELVFRELEEVELEFRSGKLSADDYHAMRDALFVRAAKSLEVTDEAATQRRNAQ
jgi:hypothetical protein